jgi:Superinfection immunity protein
MSARKASPISLGGATPQSEAAGPSTANICATKKRRPVPIGAEEQLGSSSGAFSTFDRRCPSVAYPRGDANAKPRQFMGNWHQRVEPAARHTIISDPPADQRTWSTSVDRQWTLAASRYDPDPAEMAVRYVAEGWCSIGASGSSVPAATAAICALNLLLGWTVIGWIAALVWALTNPPRANAYKRKFAT